MAEELMDKTMNEGELAQVSGGTRIETYDIIKFYKSKGIEGFIFPRPIKGGEK